MRGLHNREEEVINKSHEAETMNTDCRPVLSPDLRKTKLSKLSLSVCSSAHALIESCYDRC